MKHIHLATCLSTQDELLNRVKNHELDFPSLISTEHQTQGHGQYGRNWFSSNGSLTFSCLLKPHEILTLSTIHIAVQIAQFFEKKFHKKIYFKWPNDLMNINGEKLGGILTQKINDDLIVGIGINLFGINKIINEQKASSLFEEEIRFDTKELSEELYSFLINQNFKFTTNYWTEHCIHIDKKVSWLENEKQISGIFLGINADGSALIETHEGKISVYSASFKII
jgi:BirA family biotin operon repressor/biotin-[acetyl-CoA-carboxylase] ligase